jgi:DNA-binding ferritin-like protein
MGHNIKPKLNSSLSPDFGIKTNDLRFISDQLSVSFSSLFYLKIKTQHFCWNYSGLNFYGLNEVLSLQILTLEKFIHHFAQRILCLGQKVPFSVNVMGKFSVIKDQIEFNDNESIYLGLMYDHESLVRLNREILDKIEFVNDEVTNLLIIEIIDFHESCALSFRRFVSDKQYSHLNQSH